MKMNYLNYTAIWLYKITMRLEGLERIKQKWIKLILEKRWSRVKVWFAICQSTNIADQLATNQWSKLKALDNLRSTIRIMNCEMCSYLVRYCSQCIDLSILLSSLRFTNFHHHDAHLSMTHPHVWHTKIRWVSGAWSIRNVDEKLRYGQICSFCGLKSSVEQ